MVLSTGQERPMILYGVRYNDFAVYLAIMRLGATVSERMTRPHSSEELHRLSSFAGHLGEFAGLLEQEARYQFEANPATDIILNENDARRFAGYFLQFLTRTPKGTARDVLTSLCELVHGEEKVREILSQ